MDNKTIIGLCGFAGAGKDTVASMICEKGFKQVAFADKLRDFAAALNAFIPEADDYYVNIIEKHGYDVAKRYVPGIREYLIRIGHCARTTIYESIWIDSALKYNDHDKIVVSDVRYPNEADAIHALGGVVWRITRPGFDGIHETEKASVPLVQCDSVIENNGTFNNLQEQVDCLMFLNFEFKPIDINNF